MKLIPTLIAAAGLCAAAPAFAAMLTVDFEGAPSFASIDNYYNGGAGANLGVNFSLPALALANDGTGSGPNGEFFSNAPTPGTVMFATDVATYMNVAAGFVGAVNFYYSSAGGSTTVNVYSGLNGSGSLLGSISFGENSTNAAPFDTWSLASVAFGGTGQSISFGDNVNVAYDNVSVNAVPLPAALLLFPFGLAGLGVVARRKREA